MEREPTAEEPEKIGSDWGVAKRGGEGGVSAHTIGGAMALTVAIFGCHLKDKGNTIVQHLLPSLARKRAPLFAVA
jgi:hypothetical protein